MHHRPEPLFNRSHGQALCAALDLLSHELPRRDPCLPVERDAEYRDGEDGPQGQGEFGLSPHLGPVYFTTSAVTSSYCSAPWANSFTALMICSSTIAEEPRV